MNLLYAATEAAKETVTTVNPEAMVRAAVAASNAESAAWYASLLSVVSLLILLGIGIVFVFLFYEIRELVVHTNGMREQLVEATRKLALIEGRILGRAEQKAAEEGGLALKSEAAT